MKSNKEQVLSFFRHDRKFANGARLYQQLGTNNAFKSQLNHALAQGNPSRVLVGQLNEALASIAGISTEVMTNYLNRPLSPRPIDEKEQTTAVAAPPPVVDPPVDDKKTKAAKAEKPATETKSGSKGKAGKEEKAPEGEKTPEAVKVADLPTPILHGMKLREEFPFLADRDCPAVLKKLVSVMLEAYDAWRHAHEDLFTAESFKAEQDATLAVLDNYLENQAIWAELNHYKTTQQLLGNHPDVRSEINRLEVEALSPIDLAKKRSNLQKSVSRYRTLIAEENQKGDKADPEKIEKWQQIFDTNEDCLKLVEGRINSIQQEAGK